jgi:hypothetical protein
VAASKDKAQTPAERLKELAAQCRDLQTRVQQAGEVDRQDVALRMGQMAEWLEQIATGPTKSG